jgi:hypothetical protein
VEKVGLCEPAVVFHCNLGPCSERAGAAGRSARDDNEKIINEYNIFMNKYSPVPYIVRLYIRNKAEYQTIESGWEQIKGARHHHSEPRIKGG